MALVATIGLAHASASVDELVREAHAYEASHREDLAVRRYTEALSLDATSEDAYLGLADLRLRLGDAREAERVYSMALEHVPTLRRALVGRARARHALGRGAEAAEDLDAYTAADPDPSLLRELAGWHAADGRLPAALAVWRRLLVRAADLGDAPLAREAKRTVRALQMLVGPSDPVTSPASTDPTRHALAAIARRGG